MSLEPQFLSGLESLLDLPILLQKGASFDETDRQLVKTALAEKIKQKDFDAWMVIFAEQDVCVEPVLSLDEALHSPLAQQRGWVVDVPLKEGSAETEPQLACPIKFSRSQAEYRFIGQALDEAKDAL